MSWHFAAQLTICNMLSWHTAAKLLSWHCADSSFQSRNVHFNSEYSESGADMTTLLKTKNVQKPNSCHNLINEMILSGFANKLPNIFKVVCESWQFRNPFFRCLSWFLMANLTQVSLPVQDLYRMMVEHDVSLLNYSVALRHFRSSHSWTY